MKLYPYQKKAVADMRALISEGCRPLLHAPTGAGKTEIAAHLFQDVDRGLRVFVVHTEQLLTQARERLGSLAAVTTIQSLLLRPEMFASAVLVGWDECHHLQGQEWRKAVQIFKPDCAMFGLSATPFASELDELFEHRVSIRVEGLIKGGYIAPVSIVRPDDEAVRNFGLDDRIDPAAAYNATHRGKQAIHFEPKVKDCERALERYLEFGVPAAVVHGKTPSAVRSVEIARFRAGELKVLISPVLLSEGFDAPNATVLVAGRAFKSDTMLIQAVGRVRRKFPGKSMAYVIDCTDCCKTRRQDFFNVTDDALLNTQQDRAAKEVLDRVAKEGGSRKPRAFNWVALPEDAWITESAPTVAQQMRAQENAELIRSVEQVLDDAKREKRLMQKREGNVKYLQDPAKRAKVYEAIRRRLQDPEKYAKKLESQRNRYLQDLEKRSKKRDAERKRLQDPEKAAKHRERSRENARRMRQDPEKYAKKLESQRARYAAKKAAQAAE